MKPRANTPVALFWQRACYAALLRGAARRKAKQAKGRCAMAGFITDAILTTAVQNTLGKSEPLASFWNGIITHANLMAYGAIAGALAERVDMPAVVAAWDRGV